ncbi:SDR family NAD(P)-dependent oxidoreductase [Aliarcobacter cryaerophilus]|uniref:SDR family NAD(P)-dependent oxidoreductase n=1 Tax=Aliarcobacter cryaerophilus TaxID=28198 RepID=UPI000AE40D75|nr:SDR family NAD(P)-dependent oxidoreductase [Aliarcobacter cryaerophilus]
MLKRVFNPIIVARREDRLLEIKKDIEAKYDVKVQIEVCDLSVDGSAIKLYEKLKSQNIDVLINNAGFGDFAFAWDMNMKKANDMLNLNIKALTELSLLYVKDYADKDSTLINVSSVGGYSQFDIAVVYCATKFYVSSFTEGLDLTLRTQGKKLRAKVLAPSGTKTEFIEEAEKNGAIQGRELFDPAYIISSDKLAEFAYDLYKSNKVMGIVDENNEFILQDAVYPQVQLK